MTFFRQLHLTIKNIAKEAIMSVQAAHISQQIQSDIHACEQLIELFSQEREALKSRDTDTLGKLIETKATHLSHLEKSAQVRFNWSKSHAQTPNDKAWEKLIDTMRDTQLKKQWDKLKHLFGECKKENEINGRLIARNQQVFGRLIEIVRGQTQSPSLYGKNGSASAQTGSNRFGQA